MLYFTLFYARVGRQTSRRHVKVGGRTSRRRRRRGPVATKGFRSSRVAGGRRRQLQLLARPGAQTTKLLPL